MCLVTYVIKNRQSVAKKKKRDLSYDIASFGFSIMAKIIIHQKLWNFANYLLKAGYCHKTMDIVI